MIYLLLFTLWLGMAIGTVVQLGFTEQAFDRSYFQAWALMGAGLLFFAERQGWLAT